MVDFEFRSGDEQKALHAVYLSPSLRHSRQAGRALEEAAITAIAASHLYDEVHFHARDEDEAERFNALVERFTSARPAAIDVSTGAL